MSRALLQQALDALENSIECVEMEYTAAVKRYGGIPSREKQLDFIKEYVEDHKDAIAALENALGNSNKNVLNEREDCARVCDERANGENDAQWCADAIRARSRS